MLLQLKKYGKEQKEKPADEPESFLPDSLFYERGMEYH